MRLIRVVPSSTRQLHEACLGSLEALLPGASILARDVTVPERGVLDLLAALPERGLVMISFDLELRAEGVAQAVARWDWLCVNLPAMRAMGGLPGGADTTSDPRLVLVAHRLTDDARRLAGRIVRPSVELIGAALVSDARDASQVAALFDAIAPLAAPALPSATVEPLLGGLPAGAPRSLIRRMIEQLGDDETRFVALEGGVDVERAGRLIGSVLATSAGVEARRARDGHSMRVETDEDCREAALFLASVARPGPLPLTAEEMAEIERPRPRATAHGARPAPDYPATSDVEN